MFSLLFYYAATTPPPHRRPSHLALGVGVPTVHVHVGVGIGVGVGSGFGVGGVADVGSHGVVVPGAVRLAVVVDVQLTAVERDRQGDLSRGALHL